jgi:hypothetical protein
MICIKLISPLQVLYQVVPIAFVIFQPLLQFVHPATGIGFLNPSLYWDVSGPN